MTRHVTYPPSPLTPAAAEWVKTAVLPKAYFREGAYAPLITKCPCQWGQCGTCKDLGKHEKCNTNHGGSVASPEAYVISRRHGGALTPVWRTGTPCRWICPCPVCDARATLPPDAFELLPAPRRAASPDQLALF
jgi:hypothetical protein